MVKSLLSGIVISAIVIIMCGPALGDPILFMDFFNPNAQWGQVANQWSVSASPVGVCYAQTEVGQGRPNQRCIYLNVPINGQNPTCWIQSPMMVTVIKDPNINNEPFTSQLWIMFPSINQNNMCIYWDGMISLWIIHQGTWKLQWQSAPGITGWITQNLNIAANQWNEFHLLRAAGANVFTVLLNGQAVGVAGNCWANGQMLTSVYMGIQTNNGNNNYGSMYLDDIYVTPNTNANYWLFEDFEWTCNQQIHGWGITKSNGGDCTVDTNNVWTNHDTTALHVCSPQQLGQCGYAWVTTTNCPIQNANYQIGLDVGISSQKSYKQFFILYTGQVRLYISTNIWNNVDLWCEQGNGPDIFVMTLPYGWNTIYCMVNLLFQPLNYDIYVNHDPDQQHPIPTLIGVPILPFGLQNNIHFGDQNEHNNQDWYYGDAYFDNIHIVQNW